MPLSVNAFSLHTTNPTLRITSGLYGPALGPKVCPIISWENDNPSGENRFKAARILSDVAAGERPSAIICNTNITTLPPLPHAIMTLILANNARLLAVPDLSTSQINLLDLTGCNALAFMPSVPKDCVVLLPDHLQQQLPEHNKTSVENLLTKLNYFELDPACREAIDKLQCPVSLQSLAELRNSPVVLVKKGGLGNDNKIMLSLYSYDAYKQLLTNKSANPETREQLHNHSTIDINKDSITFDPDCGQIKLALFEKLDKYFCQQGHPDYFNDLAPVFGMLLSTKDFAPLAQKLSERERVSSDDNAALLSNSLKYFAARLQFKV